MEVKKSSYIGSLLAASIAIHQGFTIGEDQKKITDEITLDTSVKSNKILQDNFNSSTDHIVETKNNYNEGDNYISDINIDTDDISEENKTHLLENELYNEYKKTRINSANINNGHIKLNNKTYLQRYIDDVLYIYDFPYNGDINNIGNPIYSIEKGYITSHEKFTILGEEYLSINYSINGDERKFS
ncbi:MAG: hypothetical protein GY828_06370, partial [Candidatus Gracilibacteria bacterium]|nr:hypothetical protein [Candidatus Gracilibacteria bacterium]